MPDEKNHGFIFLVDWSGSMINCMDSTIDQLVNLIYFAKKINIPFEVYAFTEFGGSNMMLTKLSHLLLTSLVT